MIKNEKCELIHKLVKFKKSDIAVFLGCAISINNINIEERSILSKYELKNSSLKLTNIRLLRDTIEEEKHSLWLNRNIVRDSDLAIIIDNAIPKMRLPYMGQAK